MKASNTMWKEKLHGKIANEQLAREIDIFDTEVRLRKQGRMDEKLFAETRLRRGAYGQRYDNGQRNDGARTRRLEFPSADLTKGPETVWDAPGMLRIKIPFGEKLFVHYLATTFSSLVFMIVGLYLPQIMKLKVAGIELEKSSTDHIRTSTSLGIQL